MAADDVAKALMAMDDEGLRRAVAAGDLEGLRGFGLDDGELDLVQSAAAEAEVEGFSFQCNFLPTGLLGNGAQTGIGAAVTYARHDLSPTLAPSFNQWIATKNAQGGW